MAPQADMQLAEAVAHEVQQRFISLPKSGKNQPHEHTVLAGIVAYHTSDYWSAQQHVSSAASVQSSQTLPPIHVIAVGTGTKCLGASKRSTACDVINDSHAEVVTRRAFVAWAYQQLNLAAEQRHKQHVKQASLQEHKQNAVEQSSLGLNHSTSAFYWCPSSCKFALRQGIKFAMYISLPPCGDASIYHTAEQQHSCTSGQPHDPADRCVSSCINKHEAEALDAEARTVRQMQQSLQDSVIVPTLAGLPQQQQPPASGRTGAKLIKLSDTADVGQAATALAGQPAAAHAAALDTDAANGSEKHKPAHAAEQQKHPVLVPSASDVEVGPQQLGALRRKPGKGDPTLSLSCSDKIARWACLGMQGCLLSSCLVAPLYLSLLVVSVPPSAAAQSASAAGAFETGAVAAIDQCQSSALCPTLQQQQRQIHRGAQPRQQAQQAVLAAAEAAGRRAFLDRLASCAAVLQPPFAVQAPTVVAVGPADNKLGLYPDETRKSPSGVSINWSCWLPLLAALTSPSAKASAATAAGVHEVTLAAHGRKAGAGRKAPNWSNKKTQSRLCSAALFDMWQALLTSVPELQHLAALQLGDVGAVGPCMSDASLEQAGCVSSMDKQPLQNNGIGTMQPMGQLNSSAYRALKQTVCRQYQQAWQLLRQTPCIFAGWILKPS